MRLRYPRFLAICFVLVLAPAARSEEPADRELQQVVRAAATPWAPCPPTLPPGCEMAVLEGDPQGEDLFTVRFRVEDSFVMPPHWHPRDERVTVLSGSVAVAFGAEAERRDATEFGAGDYYVNAPHAVHQVWIEGPTIIQITGIGPWKAIPAETAPPAAGDDESHR